jgi:hypothetical protein
VLDLMAQGLTNTGIAKHLVLSRHQRSNPWPSVRTCVLDSF